MKIVLVATEWLEATPEMLKALEGISYHAADRVIGCSTIPSICAVDDAGYLRKEWRRDSASFDPKEIAQWAADNTVSFARPRKSLIIERYVGDGRWVGTATEDGKKKVGDT
jgi:hypothetical protein